MKMGESMKQTFNMERSEKRWRERWLQLKEKERVVMYTDGDSGRCTDNMRGAQIESKI